MPLFFSTLSSFNDAICHGDFKPRPSENNSLFSSLNNTPIILGVEPRKPIVVI